MKCFAFLISIIVSSFFYVLSAHSSEQQGKIEIESITYELVSDNKESIVFKLSGQKMPNAFQLKGDNPRLVVDFTQAVYKGKNVIPINKGRLTYAIRTGAHDTPTPKIRVVVDLASGNDIKYEKVFLEDENILKIHLISAVAEEVEKLANTQVTPAKEAKEKTVPPVFATKELSVESSIPIASGTEPELLEISFDDSSNKGEMILFRLNDFYPPTVTALEKDQPRVLCDFLDMKLGAEVNKNITANGKFVERIRTARHEDPEKVRVVLDLLPDRDYDLQQVFFKNDNLFVLIVNELQAEEEITD